MFGIKNQEKYYLLYLFTKLFDYSNYWHNWIFKYSLFKKNLTSRIIGNPSLDIGQTINYLTLDSHNVNLFVYF